MSEINENPIVNAIFAFVWVNHISMAYFTPSGQKTSNIQFEKDLGVETRKKKIKSLLRKQNFSLVFVSRG